jgi:hypothetical protein
MPKELRCGSCDGGLAWTGRQLSCYGCGQVYSLQGKPNTGLGLLIAGVGIGLILGFIGAYELMGFINL